MEGSIKSMRNILYYLDESVPPPCCDDAVEAEDCAAAALAMATTPTIASSTYPSNSLVMTP